MRAAGRLARTVAAAAALAVSVTAGTSGPGTGTADAAPPAPRAVLSPTIAPVGQLVSVTGSGWAPVGGTVDILICGNDALGMSADCDQSDTYQAAIRDQGTFYAGLHVLLPPVPCPCVVWVTNVSGAAGLKLPLQIPGAPVAPLHRIAAPSIEVSARVETHASLSALFGGPDQVTLVLRVANASRASYAVPAVSVTVGRGRDPTGYAVGRSLASIPARSVRTVRLAVSIPAVTFGHYTLRADLATGPLDVVAVSGATTYPWGLLIVPVLALLLVAWAVVGIRRRLHRGRDAPGTLALPGGEGGP